MKHAGRACWLVFWCLVAFTTMGAQIDFSTRDRPALAPLVPEAFRSHAYVTLTSIALATGDKDGASIFAHALVKHRPVPAESLSTLAVAAAAEGQGELSSKAITASARRGWRDPLAQLAVLESAIANKQWGIAAERLDAMMRSGSADLAGTDRFALLLDHPEGRAALAKRLAVESSWLPRFLLKGSRTLEPQQFADVVGRVESKGAEMACSDLASAALSLLMRQSPASANEIWSQKCRTNSSSTSQTFDFIPLGVGASPGPFDWRYPESPGVSRSFHKTGNHWTLKFRNRDRLRQTIAERYFTMKSGGYTLTLSRDAETSSTSVLSYRIRCVGEKDNRIIDQGQLTRYQAAMRVDANCPVQKLEIVSGPGSQSGLIPLISR